MDKADRKIVTKYESVRSSGFIRHTQLGPVVRQHSLTQAKL